MADLHPQERLLEIGDALSRLPLETPLRSAWPQLAKTLPKRARARWPWALAAAAVLLIALGLPRTAVSPLGDHSRSGVAVADPVAALMSESARLESLVASAHDERASSASAAMLGLEIEDRLHAVDSSLAAARLSEPQRLALWQQRVALLRDYAGLETSRRWYAAEGQNLDVALVAAY